MPSCLRFKWNKTLIIGENGAGGAGIIELKEIEYSLFPIIAVYEETFHIAIMSKLKVNESFIFQRSALYYHLYIHI